MRYDPISPDIDSFRSWEFLLVKRTSLCLASPVFSCWDFPMPHDWSSICFVIREILSICCAETPVTCNYVEIIKLIDLQNRISINSIPYRVRLQCNIFLNVIYSFNGKVKVNSHCLQCTQETFHIIKEFVCNLGLSLTNILVIESSVDY